MGLITIIAFYVEIKLFDSWINILEKNHTKVAKTIFIWISHLIIGKESDHIGFPPNKFFRYIWKNYLTATNL